LPPGTYYIVDRPAGGLLGPLRDFFSGADEWFALYNDDGQADDYTEVCEKKECVIRGNFRLHPGSRSAGCLTLTDLEDYNKLRDALLNTETSTIPGTNTPYYGTITVYPPATGL
jgi:hypothetical protein